MDYICPYLSPLGDMTLVSDGDNLTGLFFDGQKGFASILKEEPIEKDLPVFAKTLRWLDIYFGGGIPDFVPPLSPKGTPFQKEVWDILLTIPYGETLTYGDIAGIFTKERGFARMSPQAIGGAVGRNPISLIVPCHRVIGTNGELVGYAGGLERKAKLLALEKGNPL